MKFFKHYIVKYFVMHLSERCSVAGVVPDQF